jgi:hypothetical protein
MAPSQWVDVAIGYESDHRAIIRLHARKLAAALQHATSASPADRPILIRREHGVGHGDRAMSSLFELALDQLGFLKHQLWRDETPAEVDVELAGEVG